MGDGLTDRRVANAELDVGGIAAEFDRVVRLACPEQLQLARRVFDRIQPDRWRLEWSLPLWLGEAFSLRPEVIAKIALSNVMGLASVRLEDDLVDGDVPPEEIAGTRVLSAVLFDAALQPYQAMFDGNSPFWAQLSGRMAEWRAASRHNGPTNTCAADLEPDAWCLPARGAPLHISAYAVCLAVDRPELYAALGRCLDHVLEALVLCDHAADWEADLDAGRWNAFIAAMSGHPEVPTQREPLRSAVRVALMTSNDAEVFFARIGDHLSRAIAETEELPVPVPRLVDHLRSLAAQIQDHGASYRVHFRGLGDQAARLLFREIADG